LDRLATGWRATQAGIAHDFVSRWRRHLDCPVEIKETGDGWLVFVSDLSDIKLLGMDAVPCILIGGHDASIRERLEEFWRWNSSGKSPFILAATEEAAALAASVLPARRCLLLTSGHITSILESDKPKSLLKTELRRQVPLRLLVPFNTEQPVDGGMFFGRTRFLERLGSEPASFAIAGPGLIGKSSLLRRYRRQLVASRDPAVQCTFFIDLYPVKGRGADEVAQHIALAIDGGSRGAGIQCDRLEAFFVSCYTRFRRPLDLLLDEVDEALPLGVLDHLAMIARKGYCRLVLAGKSRLLSAMLDQSAPFSRRLSLMRLDPLTDPETENLFLKPMEDLGFRVTDKHAVLSLLQELTGKQPSLVQYYGKAAAGLMLGSGSDTLDTTVLETVRDAHETSTLVLGSITSLRDTGARELALGLLSLPRQPYTIPQVQTAVRSRGVELTAEETWRLCNDLLMRDVLAWDRGLFRVANGSLVHHARAGGLLAGAPRNVPRKAG